VAVKNEAKNAIRVNEETLVVSLYNDTNPNAFTIIFPIIVNNDKIHLGSPLQQIPHGNSMLDPHFINRQNRDPQSIQCLSMFQNRNRIG